MIEGPGLVRVVAPDGHGATAAVLVGGVALEGVLEVDVRIRTGQPTLATVVLETVLDVTAAQVAVIGSGSELLEDQGGG